MARECGSTGSQCIDSDVVLKVWGVINGHFESALASAGRSDVVTRAKTEIKSQVAELRDVVNNCVKRLSAIEDYIRELQSGEGVGLEKVPPSPISTCTDLTGDWHYLYLSTGCVFGYMKLIPETVTVTDSPDPITGARKRAEFTLPIGILREAEALIGGVRAGSYGTGHALLCPCCQVSFGVTEFWKHAVFEIASRGNVVPAWQVLDRYNRPKWVVDHASGWRDPIYRPRDSRGMREIGQSLSRLSLHHFLSDQDFSSALDIICDYFSIWLKN